MGRRRTGQEKELRRMAHKASAAADQRRQATARIEALADLAERRAARKRRFEKIASMVRALEAPELDGLGEPEPVEPEPVEPEPVEPEPVEPEPVSEEP